jgi:UDP-N-acetylmuramate--alanine ligase
LLSINSVQVKKIHFVGIFGSGMSAIAQFLCWKGISVTGSDRSVNSEATGPIQDKLEKIGCSVFSQDGSGIAEDTDMICISTAIEEDNPDLVAARTFSVQVSHRSDILAAIVKMHITIAVAGTSGKSTVTAMVFEFLSYCGKGPSLITGAPLIRLEEDGYIGNAFCGTSDLLVIEADESDGSLIKYTPYLSLFLNVSKDHKPVQEVLRLFQQLKVQSRNSIANADDTLLAPLSTKVTYALENKATCKPDSYTSQKATGVLFRKGCRFALPLPGLHNLSNCCGALAVAEHFGCTPECLAQAVENYRGVARRFTIYPLSNGITVVDDFAHNPAKIEAAVTAARTLSPRVFAIYQPHGFGPTRFLRNEYKELFRTLFTEKDTLFILPIYYAGGRAVKDISSNDLKNDLNDIPFRVVVPGNRDEILPDLKESVHSGDVIIVMGARDPSLPLFARSIIDTLDS